MNTIEKLIREKNRLILMSSLSSLEPEETRRLKAIDSELSKFDQAEVKKIDDRLSQSFPSKRRILAGL